AGNQSGQGSNSQGQQEASQSGGDRQGQPNSQPQSGNRGRSSGRVSQSGGNRSAGGGSENAGDWLRNFDRLNDNSLSQAGPLAGGAYGPWSDRLREVEEMIEFPDLRNQVAIARE